MLAARKLECGLAPSATGEGRHVQRRWATMEKGRAANGTLQGVDRAIEKTARRIMVAVVGGGEIWLLVVVVVRLRLLPSKARSSELSYHLRLQGTQKHSTNPVPALVAKVESVVRETRLHENQVFSCKRIAKQRRSYWPTGCLLASMLYNQTTCPFHFEGSTDGIRHTCHQLRQKHRPDAKLIACQIIHMVKKS